MKKIFFLLFLFAELLCDAQPYLYKKDTAMIRMRDGVRLFTVIYTPVSLQGKFPFMIERTPYGALNAVTPMIFLYPGYAEMAKTDIFIFRHPRQVQKPRHNDEQADVSQNRSICHR
jgi:hypothetical protein